MHCKEALESKGLQAQADNPAVADEMVECKVTLQTGCDFWDSMIGWAETFRQGCELHRKRSEKLIAKLEPRLAELEAEIERRGNWPKKS